MNELTTNMCSVIDCRNRRKPIYRFPNFKKARDVFNQWVAVTRIPRFRNLTAEQIYCRGHICSRHFKVEDYVINSKRLLRTAVPSLCLGPESRFEVPFTILDSSSNETNSGQIDLPLSLETESTTQLIDNCEFFLNPKEFPIDVNPLIPPYLYPPSITEDRTEYQKEQYQEVESANSLLQRLWERGVTEDVPVTTEESDTLAADDDNDWGTQQFVIEEKPIRIHPTSCDTLSSVLFDNASVAGVCRICLCSLGPDVTTTQQSEHVTNMIKLVLPDLDLTMFSENVYCGGCVELLTHSCQLKETWLMAEAKLQRALKEKKQSNRVVKEESDPAVMDHSYNKTPHNLFEATLDPAKRKILEEVQQPRKAAFGPGPYQCDKCGRTYDNLSRFKTHQAFHRRIRNRPRIVRKKRECPVCSHEFFSTMRFIKHMEKHFAVKKKRSYKCPTCNKTLTTKHSFNVHVKHHHLRQYDYVQCHFCGKTLTSSSSLRIHMKIHNDKKHECGICHKKFHHAATLRRHQGAHNSEKLWRCEYCGKLIKYEKSLIRHVRVFHTDGGDNVCHICHKPFTNTTNLKRHKIRVHGWVPNSQNPESVIVTELSET